MENNLMITSSPHIVDTSSTRKIMLDVVIALAPAMVMAGFNFGARALLLIAVSVVSCVGFEWIYCKAMKRPVLIGDFSAVCTGILLAFNLPATLPLWMAVLGAAFAIIVVKQLFGGLGYNFANPAVTARIVLAVAFAGKMTTFIFPKTYGGVDALATATPLAIASGGGNVPILDLLIGSHGGVIGETCAVALLLGGAYLLFKKVISPAIPLTYLGTVAVLSLLGGQDVLVQLLSGGLLLGAIFMATDYVTSPFTLLGKIVFGIGLGIITCGIRFFGTMTEGVSYAILIMNLLVPFINQLTRKMPLGGAKK